MKQYVLDFQQHLKQLAAITISPPKAKGEEVQNYFISIHLAPLYCCRTFQFMENRVSILW